MNTIFSEEFRHQRSILINNISVDLIKNQFSDHLINATISIEDKRFYSHYGHDIFSIFRAIINNMSKNRIQGASTIEQQLIRIILKKNELTLKRKYFEITLSTEISKRLSKSETINKYLNSYLFHSNIIGVSSLCKKENYLIDQLSNKDIYEIVARFKYPKVTKENHIRYLKRVRTIELKNNDT
ncbi:MAG: biosynthetic peptidoglycan transglycosylase [Lutibacter sp.]|nr:biosynthetic peptidoglycan transglycosylase [Lutibacter sp.]